MSIVCTPGGVVGSQSISLGKDLKVTLPSGERLSLYAMCQNGDCQDVYYLFSSEVPNAPCLEQRPSFCTELLIPLPMVPLRESSLGLRMLCPAEWDALLQEAACAAPPFLGAVPAPEAASALLPEAECLSDASPEAASDAPDTGSEASEGDSESTLSSEEDLEDDDVQSDDEGLLDDSAAAEL